MTTNYGHKLGPGFIEPAKFKALPRKRLQALRNALAALEMAQKRRDGPRASKYADRLCDLAMSVQGHFHFMRKRACLYVDANDL